MNYQKIAGVMQAMEELNAELTKLALGTVEVDTKQDVNYKSGELELCIGARDGSQAWSITYRTQMLPKKPVDDIDSISSQESTSTIDSEATYVPGRVQSSKASTSITYDLTNPMRSLNDSFK